MKDRYQKIFRVAREGWQHFWMEPASAWPLAALRVGVSALLLVQAYWIAPSFLELYGQQGILQGTLADYVRSSDLPNVTSLVRGLAGFGFSENTVLVACGLAYVSGLVGLLLGWRTRWMAGLVWGLHLCLAGGHITSYGIDTFAGILLFYFLWLPVGAVASLDAVAGTAPPAVSSDARLGLRVVQIHLCLVYLACGLEKAAGSQWWNGEAIWRSVMMPEYAQYSLAWLSQAPWLAKVFGWGTLVVESGYACFMWVPRLRPFWLLAIVGLHLGILLLMGLTLFALMMMVLSTAAFAVPSEPGWRFSLLPVWRRLAFRRPVVL